MNKEMKIKKIQINKGLKKHKKVNSQLIMSTSSSLKKKFITEENSPIRNKSSQKISINNINVNTNNLNLNTTSWNIDLYKKINTMTNSPIKYNNNSNNNSNNSSSIFDKNVVNELRNQFFEIKKKKKNINEYNNNNNITLNYDNSKKNLKANLNENKSKERKSKVKMGKKSLNLFDNLKNNFLNQNTKNNNNNNNNIIKKERNESREIKNKNLSTKTQYCETENLSSLDLNSLNKIRTYDNTRNLKNESIENTNNTNESFQIKEIFNKYNNEINENKKLKKENYELRKWINVLKDVIIIQNNIFKNKINEYNSLHTQRENTLIKENNKLKKVIIDSFDAIKIFDKNSFEYNNKLNRTYSQILTENNYLRKILLNKNQGNQNKNKIKNRNYNFSNKYNYHLNRNSSKIKLEKNNEEKEQTKVNYVNTITHFGNSHVYLNQTMKKEMLNNIKGKSSLNNNNNANSNSNFPFRNKLLNQIISKLKYKK